MRADIRKQVQQHLSLFNVEDVKAIFQPMAKYFQIDYMEFARIFRDGSDINLTTHPGWLEYYYTNQLYCENPLEKEIENYSDSYVAWSQLTRNNRWVEMGNQQAGLFYRFVVIKPNHLEGYCDFYYFGANQQNIHFEKNCLNNLDLIEGFINHFNYYAADMITELAKQPVCIANKFNSNIVQLDDLCFYQNKIDRQKFMSELRSKGTIVDSGDHLTKLTKREAGLVPLIISGLSMREIAKQCSISPRTVETHLVHIKEKLHVESKSDLIKKLRATDAFCS
ncbi:MAG: helix-turn-helix transcriptional regulator [Coxiellaceae bacterium]|nr:helix-turn-helix transcriptional regulator [Coxiellaceae bacterium]